MLSLSPTLTSEPAFATFPLISTLPPLHTSLATVRLLINRDTFKY